MSTAGEVRIGTREREDAIRCLGEHLSEGRLFPDEYEHRASQAAAATVRSNLVELFGDLPEPKPVCLAPPPVLAAPAPPPIPAATQQPVAYQSIEDRELLVGGVLQIVLPFGVGRFYRGHKEIAIAQLVLAFSGFGVIWSIVDGILMLVRSTEQRRYRKRGATG